MAIAIIGKNKILKHLSCTTDTMHISAIWKCQLIKGLKLRPQVTKSHRTQKSIV